MYAHLFKFTMKFLHYGGPKDILSFLTSRDTTPFVTCLGPPMVAFYCFMISLKLRWLYFYFSIFCQKNVLVTL